MNPDSPILETLEQVAAAETRFDVESLWQTMTKSTSPLVGWAAESALGRIERARFAAVGR